MIVYEENQRENYHKIGGFLIIVAILLIMSTIRLGGLLGKYVFPVYSNETLKVFETLDENGSAFVFIFELASSAILFLFFTIVLIYFFRKSKLLPRLIIILLGLNLIFTSIDYYFVSLFLPSLSLQANSHSIFNLVKVFVLSISGIFYFLISKRVKGTFVK